MRLWITKLYLYSNAKPEIHMSLCTLFQNILGEIYQVDNKMLKHLDWFEDCPAWYKRQKIFVNMITHNQSTTNSSYKQDDSSKSIPSDYHDDGVNSKKATECWVYLLENFKEDLVGRRYFADYSDAAKVYGYEKEMEDAEENYLECVTSETLE